MPADALRRAVAKLVGAFALVFAGMGAIAFASQTGQVGIARLVFPEETKLGPYLRPLAPIPVGPPETGLEEPRPGETAAS